MWSFLHHSDSYNCSFTNICICQRICHDLCLKSGAKSEYVQYAMHRDAIKAKQWRGDEIEFHDTLGLFCVFSYPWNEKHIHPFVQEMDGTCELCAQNQLLLQNKVLTLHMHWCLFVHEIHTCIVSWNMAWSGNSFKNCPQNLSCYTWWPIFYIALLPSPVIFQPLQSCLI